ncbi:hypothetical protein JCM8097_002823 [Rhodosporidiobolus ruineniae]
MTSLKRTGSERADGAGGESLNESQEGARQTKRGRGAGDEGGLDQERREDEPAGVDASSSSSATVLSRAAASANGREADGLDSDGDESRARMVRERAAAAEGQGEAKKEDILASILDWTKSLESGFPNIDEMTDRIKEDMMRRMQVSEQRQILRARNSRKLLTIYPIPTLHDPCTVFPSDYPAPKPLFWTESEFYALDAERLAQLLRHHGLPVADTVREMRRELKAQYLGL